MGWAGIPGRAPDKSGGVGGLAATLRNGPTRGGLNEDQAESWGELGSRGRG